MKKKIKICIFAFCIALVLHLIYINRPIKLKHVLGVYSCIFYYGEIHSTSMLILKKDGTYVHSYMHRSGIAFSDKGKYHFRVDDDNDVRIGFENIRFGDIHNPAMSKRYSFDNTPIIRNIWGKTCLIVHIDFGDRLIRQGGL